MSQELKKRSQILQRSWFQTEPQLHLQVVRCEQPWEQQCREWPTNTRQEVWTLFSGEVTEPSQKLYEEAFDIFGKTAERVCIPWAGKRIFGSVACLFQRCGPTSLFRGERRIAWKLPRIISTNRMQIESGGVKFDDSTTVKLWARDPHHQQSQFSCDCWNTTDQVLVKLVNDA